MSLTFQMTYLPKSDSSLPLHYEDALKEELSELLHMGIFKHTASPYAFPFIAVLKNDQTLHLCVNHRKLNKITLVQVELMPNPEDLFAECQRKHFSLKIDLSRGYWKIVMAEDSKKYTDFSFPLENLDWTHFSFGLSGAAATFTKLMRKLMWGRQDSLIS